MKRLLVAVLVLPLTQSLALAQNAPAGDATAGKAVWDRALCKNCHGDDGQGAFGPDLAGRGLNVAEFKQAVRKPWGIMPAFVETQVSDKQIADLAAYFAGLPKAQEPGKWKVEVKADTPPGQAALINLGCAQCHGETFNGPRGNLATVNADFDEFATLVYNHTTALPKARAAIGAANANNTPLMGNFNRTRVTEASLREIYYWTRDEIGYRAPLQARLGKGEPAANGVTYKLDVNNIGLPGKGLTAEGVTVRLQIPAGVNVVSATGAGYQGVQGNMAVWQIPTLAPKDQQSYTITLSKAGSQADNLRGNIRWVKPAPKTGPSEDVVNIAPAPL
ncbi:MAG TPA: c-type cytochrome [Micropepsaceae bacterium]|nr:c-type cytochrome [Micropepsaceae bacterium]